jgi:hypothetical protein
MLADYLSNYIQHPTQKMDYGIFNKIIGREVDQVRYACRSVLMRTKCISTRIMFLIHDANTRRCGGERERSTSWALPRA